MQLLQKRIPAAAVVVLSMTLAAPVRAEVVVIEAYTVAGSGGMTRDSLSDANLTAATSTRTAPRTTTHRRRTRIDPKDFAATRPYHRHHDEVRQKRSQVAAATTTPKRRPPVVSFVYWWNGWVIRTFHTKVGTVLLGTVGAKS